VRLRHWFRKREILVGRILYLEAQALADGNVQETTKGKKIERKFNVGTTKVTVSGPEDRSDAIICVPSVNAKLVWDPKSPLTNTDYFISPEHKRSKPTKNPATSADAIAYALWEENLKPLAKLDPIVWAGRSEADKLKAHLNLEKEPVLNENIQTTAFAKAIGLSHPRRSYLLDHVFQMRLPGFSSLVMPNDDAQKLANTYGGLYWIFRIEPMWEKLKENFKDADIVISRAVAVIRYPIPHRAEAASNLTRRITKNMMRVRTKVVWPIYVSQEPDSLRTAKYDGCVSYTRDNENRLQWLMEMRQNQKIKDVNVTEDIMLLYTGVPGSVSEGLSECRGHLLTQSQDADRWPLSADVLLVRDKDVYLDKIAPPLPDDLNIYRGGHYVLRKTDKTNGVIDPEYSELEHMQTNFGFIVGYKTDAPDAHATEDIELKGEQWHFRNRSHNRNKHARLSLVDWHAVKRLVVQKP
jgi:hypothetical protein